MRVSGLAGMFIRLMDLFFTPGRLRVNNVGWGDSTVCTFIEPIRSGSWFTYVGLLSGVDYAVPDLYDVRSLFDGFGSLGSLRKMTLPIEVIQTLVVLGKTISWIFRD